MKVASFARSLRRRLFLQSLEDRTTPATFTVSNTNDAGVGSLRQAFLDATADTSGAHTIDATGVTGTISLQSALPPVAGNWTLNGSGSSKLTVTCGVAGFRVFTTSTSAVVTFAASGMTLSNGNVTATTDTANNNGGAINFDNDTLTLTDVQLINNKTVRAGGALAGGQNPGLLTLTN